MKEGALHISSKLSKHGYNPFLIKVNNKGQYWYRVMVGPYASRKEALRYQARLKKEFSCLNAIVVSSKNMGSL